MAVHCRCSVRDHSKPFLRHLHVFSVGARKVQEIQTSDGSSLLHLLRSDLGSAIQHDGKLAKLSDALPTILNGSMTNQSGWRALSWTMTDLTSACNGDTYVPVEVSTNNGDYRDLHRSVSRGPHRKFEAGVPVPLSFLAEHIQQLEPAAQQVHLTPTGMQVSSQHNTSIERLQDIVCTAQNRSVIVLSASGASFQLICRLM